MPLQTLSATAVPGTAGNSAVARTGLPTWASATLLLLLVVLSGSRRLVQLS